MICFSNNGQSNRSVDPAYVAQTGEALFKVDYANQVTNDQLTAAFAGYLTEYQQQKNALINAQRDTLEQAGFTYLGKTIQSDPISAQRIQFAAFSAQQAIANNTVFSLNWTCADNSILTLTAAQTVSMALTLTQNVQTLFTHAQALKTQVANATTTEAVDAIANW